MKKLIIAAALTALCGCVNLYTRFPTTDTKITRCYQSTTTAAGLSLIIAFPQCMADVPSRGWMWENCFTIPLGCLGLCDALCEGVIDTVALPVDWPLSASRSKKDEN